ncbi:MAG: protein-glutamate O-methyltransferase CheR [Gemmatimonadales bacterium]
MKAAADAEWRLLTGLIESRFGLCFPGIRREILESRLRARLQELHLESYNEYYRYLRTHPDREAEFTHLACRITNNETYFFREAHQFAVLTRDILPPLLPQLRSRPLRLLSAGCSSGEEAYSLAITLQNAGLERSGVAWGIDACDVNADRIARARAGVYEESALRACDAQARARYFTQTGTRFRLNESHRAGVRFFEANLALPGAPIQPGIYDAIFCRNLLIYFSTEAFDGLIRQFAGWLRPGGYLLLGHAESLIDRGTEFEPVCLPDAVVYRAGRLAA